MPTEEITIDDLVNWYCEEHNIVLWKDVPGYEGLYQVSNVGGKVFSLVTGKLLNPSIASTGYYVVSLTKDKVHTKFSVHRLVAKTWIPNPNNYLCVNHRDECKTSNNAGNLEWCDYTYNNNYGTCRQRTSRTLGGAEIVQLTLKGTPVKTFSTISEASKETGVPTGNICKVLKGERYKAGGYIWSYSSSIGGS